MAEKQLHTPEAVDLYVGNVIRSRRLAIGASQQALAAALVLLDLLEGDAGGRANRVSASMLWRIARFLSLPVDAFFPDADDRGAPRGSDEVELFGGTPGGFEIARDYLMLDPLRRRALRNMSGILVATMGGAFEKTDAALQALATDDAGDDAGAEPGPHYVGDGEGRRPTARELARANA